MDEKVVRDDEGNVRLVIPVVRIGSLCEFELVTEPIPVRVALERIGSVGIDLIAVAQSVAVRIGLVGIGAEACLLSIVQSVPVGIGLAGISPGVDFVEAAEAIPVGIVVGVGHALVEAGILVFHHVVDPVAVGVFQVDGGSHQVVLQDLVIGEHSVVNSDHRE